MHLKLLLDAVDDLLGLGLDVVEGSENLQKRRVSLYSESTAS